MQFVYPGFLLAFLAVLIPIIIHLFHFRRFRKIYFPNVVFLQQLSDESKKQSRLKHLLVLTSRILAISFLVMAFAQPFIPSENSVVGQQGNLVGVYIDNSFSMEALAASGRLLDQARENAREVAALYEADDRFILLTNDFEGRHQRFLSQEEFLSLVDEVHESPAVKTIAEVMERQGELMKTGSETSRSSYIISDFRKSTSGIEDVVADTTVSSFFIPLSAQQAGNVFIDTMWFESPVKIVGQPVSIKAIIRNDNDLDLENQSLRLHLNGEQRAVASWDAPAYGQAEVDLTWTINSTGIQHGRVDLVDYPVTFDDQLHFSFSTTTEVPVLSIDQGGTSPFLRALFGNDSTFSFTSMSASAIDYSSFGNYNTIVVNNLNSISSALSRELQQFTEAGGSLVVFPGNDLDLNSWNAFLSSLGVDVFSGIDTTSTRVTGLNELHEVFSGVFENLPENIDLPVVEKFYPIRKDVQSGSQYLLQMQNGDHFFSSYSSERGNVFLSAVALDDGFSNLPRHPVFVPMMVNIAMQSQAFEQLYQVHGENQPVIVRGQPLANDEVFVLKGPEIEAIPEQRQAGNLTRLFFHDQIKEAGSYILTRGERDVKGVSFNYNRKESLLEAYTIDELQEMLLDQGLGQISIIDMGENRLKQSLSEFSTGLQLWKYFIILALLFLLTEALLLRFWK